MRGEDILAAVTIPSIQPGGYTTVPIAWTPDTTGVMHLYLRAVLLNDPDSLNNESYPLTIDVQPEVANDDQIAAPEVSLISSYPNPFTTETTLSFNLKTSAYVKIEIYNLKGQKLKSILDGKQAQGSQSVKWNGTDNSGKRVAKGIYLCKLTAGKDIITRRLVLIK
jgi:hypothetical protein